jgi:glycine/D-amino acid oxidase-like deaminating enzyme/nitrite reductase/ring-hydroxylating ferredoxin subunit
MKNKKDSTPLLARDGNEISPWQALAAVNLADTTRSTSEIYDCLIIGGGITGVTAALQLQQAGQRTLLVEAYTIGFGTTGGTSAHINTFADTTYQEAESAFGSDGAKVFAEAINEGFELIGNQVKKYRIDCDFESKTGYLYAEDEDQVKQLDDIYKGAASAGVAVNYTDAVPTPVEFKKALAFPGQAQFHPLKYLQGLQKEYLKAGGIIREHTRVENIDSADGVHVAKTTGQDIRTRKMIYATHMPPGITVFNFNCAPYRSYVIGVKLTNDSYPDGLVYDLQEPYHYVRSHVINGEQLLLVGGNDHKTGHADTERAFAGLEKYVRQYYPVSSVAYRWSAQYYVPADGLPYVGQVPFQAEGIYTATGFNGNGMMLGSISGKILADLVLGKANAYAELFSTTRIKPVDSFSEMVKENADAAYHFIADRFNIQETDSLKQLSPGTGKVLEIDGAKVAAYCDDEGVIHALNPVCTHAKCIVGWNAAEKSWDCPCHGARFDVDGQVLTGPAGQNLEMIPVPPAS